MANGYESLRNTFLKFVSGAGTQASPYIPAFGLDRSAGSIASPTLSSVASSASSGQALAANTARQGVIAVNTDANDCYLKYGSTASLTSFTVRIPSGGYWEMPLPIYNGRIDVIWSAAGSGSLFLTEL